MRPVDDPMRLEDKVAIVTGASRGIGRAIALAYAREGADVVINYLRSDEQALETATRIERIGRQALAIQADVSSAPEAEKMVRQTLDLFGRIDLLVNNAGTIEAFDFETPDYENWQRMVDVNIKGILVCSQGVAGPMQTHGGGRIINIVAKETRGSLDYIMTKAAGDVLTRGLARQLAPLILVNAIAPGYIDTGWISQLDQRSRESIRRETLLQRWGAPEDVAKVAVFLGSDDSSYLTGSTILVDGGAALA
jgi:3-oxoacyl-[acyl-carrier protein] reductase